VMVLGIVILGRSPYLVKRDAPGQQAELR
jgi:hypothetical protein